MKVYSSIVDDNLVDKLGDFVYFKEEEDAKEFCRLQGDTDYMYLNTIEVLDHKEAKEVLKTIPPITNENSEEEYLEMFNKIKGDL